MYFYFLLQLTLGTMNFIPENKFKVLRMWLSNTTLSSLGSVLNLDVLI